MFLVSVVQDLVYNFWMSLLAYAPLDNCTTYLTVLSARRSVYQISQSCLAAISPTLTLIAFSAHVHVSLRLVLSGISVRGGEVRRSAVEEEAFVSEQWRCEPVSSSAVPTSATVYTGPAGVVADGV